MATQEQLRKEIRMLREQKHKYGGYWVEEKKRTSNVKEREEKAYARVKRTE